MSAFPPLPLRNVRVILPRGHGLLLVVGLDKSRSTSSLLPLGFRPVCDVNVRCFASEPVI